MPAPNPTPKRPRSKPAFSAPKSAPSGPKHRAKKRLGQNFLVDMTVVDRIVEAAELGPEDQVLEIGPGQGVLTRALAAKAGKVVCVELDQSLAPFLSELQFEHPNVTVVWGDFLKTPWESLPFDFAKPIKVVANIPYYITTPILMALLQADRLAKEPFTAVKPLAERILLMIQKEVADRLLAAPGSKTYGSLTIASQYASAVERVVPVPARAFRPRPQVDSAVVRLFPRSSAPVETIETTLLFKLVRAGFNQRRKTLLNSLAAGGWTKPALHEAAAKAGIDLERRPESLALEEFARLADALALAPAEP